MLNSHLTYRSLPLGDRGTSTVSRHEDSSSICMFDGGRIDDISIPLALISCATPEPSDEILEDRIQPADLGLIIMSFGVALQSRRPSHEIKQRETSLSNQEKKERRPAS